MRSRAGFPVRDVDHSAERDERGVLDGLRKRRVRRQTVGDGLDGCSRVDRDDARLNHVGHVRADHHEAEQ